MASADTVGQQLRARRQSLELSLDEVAESTKIRAWYLEALEEDNRARLPADVYALGFLRAYARHLGLDAGDLVDRWRAASRAEAAPQPPASDAPEPPSPPPAQAPARTRVAAARPSRVPPATSRRSGAWWVVGMLVSVALVGLMLVLLHRGAAHPTAGAPRHHGTRAAGASPRTKHASTAKPKHHARSHSSGTSASGVVLVSQTSAETTYRAPQGPVTLQLSFSKPCWVEVWINGTTANPYGHVYQPGQSVTLTGSTSVKVRLGHPGGTALSANGHSLPALGPNATDLLVTTGS